MQRVALNQIVFDAGTQVREALDPDHVAAIAEAMTEGADIPPIVLFHDGSRYYIGDGFHRYMAAKRNDWREIDAEVHAGTRADALWFGLGANRKNGKNMTPADKRHAILLALKEWPDRSANQIAQQIGCGQQYVSRIREEVTPMRNLPSRVTGKDGKSYPASRASRPATEPTILPDPPAPSRSAIFEARKAAAMEGASEAVIRRLPRKQDAELITNAVHSLQGVISVLAEIDPSPLLSHEQAAYWKHHIAEAVGALRAFNRKLQQEAA